MVITGAGPGHHAGGDGGCRTRTEHRGVDPPAVRAGRQPGHRRRRQVRQHEVLLHPQADAGQGEQRVRVPARRLRHARRDVRAAHPHPDGQGHAGADRVPRHARRPYWEEVAEFDRVTAVARGLAAPLGHRSCTSSPTRARPRSTRSTASTPTTTACATSATCSSSASSRRRPTSSSTRSTTSSPTCVAGARSSGSSRCRSRCAKNDRIGFARIAFTFVRRWFGDLRQMIDASTATLTR